MVRRRVGGTTSAEVDDERIGVVGLKVQRPAVGRQPSRLARIHEDTGVPTQLACMRFALVHVTSVDDGAAE